VNILVLGTPDDVRGFALAGVRGRVPRAAGEAAAMTRTDVETAVAEADRAGVELMLVSAEVAALAPHALAQARAIVVTLPATGATADAGAAARANDEGA
jgi:vacuolar-type H+-ATPase subunit F/Vma7